MQFSIRLNFGLAERYIGSVVSTIRYTKNRQMEVWTSYLLSTDNLLTGGRASLVTEESLFRLREGQDSV